VLTVWKASITGGLMEPALARTVSKKPNNRVTARGRGIFNLTWISTLPYSSGEGYDALAARNVLLSGRDDSR
jgi:hypothetical protein